jgi:replicative DNA helicase
MITPHLEKIFFHNIIGDNAYLENSTVRFFDDEVIRKVFPHVKEFRDKYRETPTCPQVLEIVRMKGIDVSPPQIEALWKIDMHEYDEDWLRDNTETFIEYKNLDLSIEDVVTYMRTTTVNAENIKETVNKVKQMVQEKNSIDFTFDEGSDFFDAGSHKQLEYSSFSSGYPFMDLVAGGGFSSKTLSIFVGQAKIGKSAWMANIAAEAVRAGNNVAIITLEMSEHKYIRRLGSNLLDLNMDEYKAKANDRDFIKGRISNLSFQTMSSLPGKLRVKEFPTSSASTIDVENWLLRTENKLGIKFKLVIIDYLNIMKNWRNPNTENTYMKIKQIAEDTRAMAQRNDWAVISATQTKQSAFDEADMAMNAVAESSGLVATVDLMFGIIQTPQMYAGLQYKLKVLANRDEGYKNCMKLFNVDYKHMRITEDPLTGVLESNY